MVMMGIIKKNAKSLVVLSAIMCPSIKIRKNITLTGREYMVRAVCAYESEKYYKQIVHEH